MHTQLCRQSCWMVYTSCAVALLCNVVPCLSAITIVKFQVHGASGGHQFKPCQSSALKSCSAATAGCQQRQSPRQAAVKNATHD